MIFSRIFESILVLGKSTKYNYSKNDISLFVCQNRFNKQLSQSNNNKSITIRQHILSGKPQNEKVKTTGS